jgi:hypothetical protein
MLLRLFQFSWPELKLKFQAVEEDVFLPLSERISFRPSGSNPSWYESLYSYAAWAGRQGDETWHTYRPIPSREWVGNSGRFPLVERNFIHPSFCFDN